MRLTLSYKRPISARKVGLRKPSARDPKIMHAGPEVKKHLNKIQSVDFKVKFIICFCEGCLYMSEIGAICPFGVSPLFSCIFWLKS